MRFSVCICQGKAILFRNNTSLSTFTLVRSSAEHVPHAIVLLWISIRCRHCALNKYNVLFNLWANNGNKVICCQNIRHNHVKVKVHRKTEWRKLRDSSETEVLPVVIIIKQNAADGGEVIWYDFKTVTFVSIKRQIGFHWMNSISKKPSDSSKYSWRALTDVTNWISVRCTVRICTHFPGNVVTMYNNNTVVIYRISYWPFDVIIIIFNIISPLP